jgi:hypothetical protein
MGQILVRGTEKIVRDCSFSRSAVYPAGVLQLPSEIYFIDEGFNRYFRVEVGIGRQCAGVLPGWVKR